MKNKLIYIFSISMILIGYEVTLAMDEPGTINPTSAHSMNSGAPKLPRQESILDTPLCTRQEDAKLENAITAYSAPRSFTELSTDRYAEYIKGLFNAGTSQKQKADSLRQWSIMAGVPILGLNQHSLFFYANLHVYPADRAPYIEFDKAEHKGVEERVTTFFYDDQIRIEDSTGRVTKEVTKKVTADLTKHALCYLYKSKHGSFFDADKFNTDADTHYLNFPFEQDGIAREFLADFTIPLERINYLDEIIQGLILLPKSVVEMMKGKALYLSNARGVSRTVITSHCQLITNYLGLMPGVFIERHKQRSQITETFIHEIGHLIDHTVLQPFYKSKVNQRSIRFYYQFPELQKLYAERDKHFTGNHFYQEHSANDRIKGKIGFITNYSEQNGEEDFAEHFVNFIIHNEKFRTLALDEAQKAKDSRLLNKFMFMKKMIERTSPAYSLPTIPATGAASSTPVA